MLIVRLMGGLGNQLQQYSLYRRMIEAGLEARLDTSWFSNNNQQGMLAPREIELDRLKGVEYIPASKEELNTIMGSDSIAGRIKRKIRRVFRSQAGPIVYENGRMYLDDLITDVFENKTCNNKILEGYFACEYYHKDMLPILRNELKFPLEEHSNPELLNELAEEICSCNSLSVHIRRGDYMDAANKEMFGGICTDDYYSTAIEYALNKIDNPKLFIFSDDLEYAERFNINLTEKCPSKIVSINRAKDSIFDMYLMSLCKHNIVANSTFSFWGARLNCNEAKMMIRPTIHRNGQEFDPVKMKEWWQGWTFISPSGKVF